MRKILIALFLCLLASAAYAARGVGSTNGVGSTDSIETGYATSCTGQCSYSVWFWYNSGGGGNLGKLWNKNTSNIVTTTEDLFQYDSIGPRLDYDRGWSLASSAIADWSIGVPSTSTWHHLVVTYDASSSSNAPLMYLDGVSQTVTTQTAPSGTLVTGTGNYTLGNRIDGQNRNWDGKIAEFAIWTGILLSQHQVTSLYLGASPLDIAPTDLALYTPLYGQLANEPDWGPSHLSQTITGTAFQPHAPVQPYPQIKYAQ